MRRVGSEQAKHPTRVLKPGGEYVVVKGMRRRTTLASLVYQSTNDDDDKDKDDDNERAKTPLLTTHKPEGGIDSVNQWNWPNVAVGIKKKKKTTA